MFDRDELLGTEDPKDGLVLTLRQEIEEARIRLKELYANIDQMQSQVEKQQHRYSNIATELRTIHDNLDTVPREDIRVKYDEALENRFKLATMRGQLELFQTQRENLEEKDHLLAQVLNQFEDVDSSVLGGEGSGISTQSTNIIRVIQAQEDEQKRLARQMHDGPAQSMTNFILQAEICQRLFDRDPERAAEELGNLKQTASTTFQKIRDFIFDLRPMMLDDLGVIPTVRKYIEDYRQKNDIEVKLDIIGEEHRLEDHQEVMVFRGIQEVIGLARDYAAATKIKILVDITRNPIKISIEDNGTAFEAEAIFDQSMPKSDPRIASLIMQKEKFELVGGSIAIESSDDIGTIVRLELPA